MAGELRLREGEKDGEAGCFLPVKARPGGRRNEIGSAHDGALRVEVTAAPEKGKANKAIIKLLAAKFDVAAGQILLVSGETDPHKLFFLIGLRQDQVTGALEL